MKNDDNTKTEGYALGGFMLLLSFLILFGGGIHNRLGLTFAAVVFSFGVLCIAKPLIGVAMFDTLTTKKDAPKKEDFSLLKKD